ncbi:MAG: PKD domain-containing protein, partial [Bacteroidetes bacterium]|nr:PKD domain-containing protein [Bacteroidota bacterium]
MNKIVMALVLCLLFFSFSNRILAQCSAPFTVDLGADATLCIGDSILLETEELGKAQHYWMKDTEADTLIDTTNITSYMVKSPGLYFVEVVNGDCSDRDSVVITYAADPSVDLGNDTTLGNGQPLTLDGNAPGMFSYAWDPGGETTETIDPTVSGTYTITITDNNGCTNTDDITVTFLPCPIANLGSDTTLCDAAT